MYKKILIATDGSDLAHKAVEHGVNLAKAVGAKVCIVTVTESWSSFVIASGVEFGKTKTVKKFEALAEKGAEKILEGAKDYAETVGVKYKVRHIADRLPAEGILEAAEVEACDLIVMASHGRRGAAAKMLGSQTAEVLANSQKPVLVLR